MRTLFLVTLAIGLCGVDEGRAWAQAPVRPSTPSSGPAASPAQVAKPGNAIAGITPPAGYVIGPDDQLSVVFWRDKDLSSEVVVRPDGMITLPLLNDIHAAGLTPEALRVILTKAAAKFVEEPNVSVAVKQINSRKAFITGQV